MRNSQIMDERKTPAGDEPVGKKKVLLVDDVKLFIELEKTFFQRKDAFEVLTAESGEEALKIVQDEQPDLVYMDLHMPKMNGDECCRRIRSSAAGRNVPIVMVTAAGKEEDRERCMDSGCNEVITKPINRGHFLSIARKYLEVYERKEPRYAVHLKIRFAREMGEFLSDFTVNINSNGLFVSTANLLPVGTALFVDFSLPETGMTIACQARVAWTNNPDQPLKKDLPGGMGLQFVDISSEEMEGITAYIERNGLTAEW